MNTHPDTRSDLFRPLRAVDFLNPPLLLAGAVDYVVYGFFRDRLLSAPGQGLVVIELTTLGGNPEVARMMGEDIRFHNEHEPDRRFVLLGKAAIHCAGATFMGFFARHNRYLTRGTRLMIHERKLQGQVTLDGPLTMCAASPRAKLNEIEQSIRMHNEGFENLIAGSSVTMEQVLINAPGNWYIEASEANSLGLIEGVI